MKFCAIIFFVVIFLNLFSGISEGSNQVDIHSHIDFLKNIKKLLHYISLGFLVGLPILSLIVINLREVPDNCEFICLTRNIKELFFLKLFLN